MYFTNIHIENIGPIDQLNMTLHNNNEKPKTLIIVGENGSGKSILLSHLVNCMLLAKQEVFDDTEIQKGKVYKYRSPNYVKSGKHYSYSEVKLASSLIVNEWQLLQTKKEFEETLQDKPTMPSWKNIKEGEHSHLSENFAENVLQVDELCKKQCMLYFPVNRFEEPGWLNLDNLTTKAKYTQLKYVSKHSNRNIICTSPLKENINWLLDLIFDRQAFEIQTSNINLNTSFTQPLQTVTTFLGYSGQSTNIYEAVIKLLKLILRVDGNIRLGAGTRRNRQIAVMKNEEQWIPNLFQLSTGEIQLLNLFLSILRDYDLSQGSFNTLEDVKGIVIIDEIDAHLHTALQQEVLPQLIASFPKVQFIVTTHSPLFLMGMDAKIGSDEFNIINMPNGEKIFSHDFSEFSSAYNAYKETARHREEISEELKKAVKPIVFVEGDYDIRYIQKSAILLKKTDILDKITLKDGGGYGGLDKIWKIFDNPISSIISAKIILIYDCDISKSVSDKNRVYRRLIPSIATNPIEKGIENLFSIETILDIELKNPNFIDLKLAGSSRHRGKIITEPEVKSVNKDEKGNMCNWICENGNTEDFKNFDFIFNIIEEILST